MAWLDATAQAAIADDLPMGAVWEAATAAERAKVEEQVSARWAALATSHGSKLSLTVLRERVVTKDDAAYAAYGAHLRELTEQPTSTTTEADQYSDLPEFTRNILVALEVIPSLDEPDRVSSRARPFAFGTTGTAAGGAGAGGDASAFDRDDIIAGPNILVDPVGAEQVRISASGTVSAVDQIARTAAEAAQAAVAQAEADVRAVETTVAALAPIPIVDVDDPDYRNHNFLALEADMPDTGQTVATYHWKTLEDFFARLQPEWLNSRWTSELVPSHTAANNGQFLGVSGGVAGWTTLTTLDNVIVAGIVEAWALQGNSTIIPKTKLLNIEAWARVNEADHLVPAAKLPVESWAIVDTVPPVEEIPVERLPVARLLPVPDVAADPGKVPTVNDSGVGYSLQTPQAGSATTSYTTWRFELVEGETQFGTAGKVFIRLRYLDAYNSSGTLTGTADAGNGYLGSDGHRHISQGNALDVKALLAATSTPALMEIVDDLPAASSATQGLFYGLASVSGTVDTVHYRKEIETANSLRLSVTRLGSISGYQPNGYSALTGEASPTIFGANGHLSPRDNDAGILALADTWILTGAQGGDYFTELVVDQSSRINGATAVKLLFRDWGSTGHFQSVILTRDLTFSMTDGRNVRRYASVNRSTPRYFRWGYDYEVKFRNGTGGRQDLALAHGEVMEQLADLDYVSQEVTAVGQDIDSLEGRVATLESGSGGAAWDTDTYWAQSATSFSPGSQSFSSSNVTAPLNRVNSNSLNIAAPIAGDNAGLIGFVFATYTSAGVMLDHVFLPLSRSSSNFTFRLFYENNSNDYRQVAVSFSGRTWTFTFTAGGGSVPTSYIRIHPVGL